MTGEKTPLSETETPAADHETRREVLAPEDGSSGSKVKSIGTPLALAAALALATFLLYWPAVGFDYVSLDDTIYVATNRTILKGITWQGILSSLTDTRVGYWTPVLWLSYMVDVELFGQAPSGFHFTNVILHVTNTILVFFLLRRLTRRTGLSLLAAAFFAAHPLRVESVVWIAERKDVLSAFFFILALLAYTEYARRGGHYRYALLLLFFSLGMMTKPILVTFPFLLLALDLWPLGRTPFWSPSTADHQVRKSWTGLILEKSPLIALSAAFGISVLFFQGSDDALHGLEGIYSLGARLKMAPTSYLVYLKKTLWPFDLPLLEFFMPYKVPSILMALSSAMVLTGLTVAAALQLRKRPYMMSSWMWYLLALFPVCGIFPSGTQWVADRFTYFPHIMLFTGIVWWIGDHSGVNRGLRRFFVIFSASLVLALCALTLVQMSYWRDGLTLFSRAVEKDPENFMSQMQLGITQGVMRDFEGAHMTFFNIVELHPDFKEARYFLGMTYADMGQHQKALRSFDEVLKLDPEFSMAHFRMGRSLHTLGQLSQAAERYEEYLRSNPHSDVSLEALTQLAAIKTANGDLDGALRTLSQALDQDQDYPKANYYKALVLSSQDRREESYRHFAKALTLDFDLHQDYIRLGDDIMAEGKNLEAVTHFEHYLEIFPIGPFAPAAHGRLGIVQMRLGNRQEATAHFSEVFEGDTGNIRLLLSLAEALTREGLHGEAARYYEQVVSLQPLSAEAYFARGRMQQADGKLEDARNSFLMGLGTNANFPETVDALRGVLLEHENVEKKELPVKNSD
jgi:tetratricopeptide (TPR) repeat protein